MNRILSCATFVAGALLTGTPLVARADQTLTITAFQDGFVRQQDPGSNFGSAGVDCVAGVDSVNGLNQVQGRFDSVLKFDAASAAAAFDSAFGAGDWTVTAVTLQVDEVAAPENAVFPRGAGQFGVAWLSDDSWTEGTGTPGSPMQPTGSELTWQSLQTMLTTATEQPMGLFASLGADGIQQFALSPSAAFKAEVVAGSVISLHAFPQSVAIGFTFHARNFGDSSVRPKLFVTATPIIRGDLNCDAILDVQDVAPFVLALLDPNAYLAAHSGCDILRADVNRDGAIDGRDVAAFVAALTG